MAHARELPVSFSTEDDRRWSQAEKGPLPCDYQFPAEAIAAAKAAPRNLSDADIARGLSAFRRRAGDGQDTPAGWAKRGAAYLATVEAKPVDLNEVVTVRGPMGDEESKVLRFLGPATVYRRKDGSKGKTPGKPPRSL